MEQILGKCNACEKIVPVTKVVIGDRIEFRFTKVVIGDRIEFRFLCDECKGEK